jgi:hypothetical protein
MRLWPSPPKRGIGRGFEPPAPRSLGVLVVCLLATLAANADAQPRRPKPDAKEAKDGAAKDPGKDAKDSGKDAAKDPAKPGGKPKVFDFTGLDLAGRLHTPQLLYFLERANEELERAFLERRSFIPHMVRSIEEEAL